MLSFCVWMEGKSFTVKRVSLFCVGVVKESNSHLFSIQGKRLKTVRILLFLLLSFSLTRWLYFSLVCNCFFLDCLCPDNHTSQNLYSLLAQWKVSLSCTFVQGEEFSSSFHRKWFCGEVVNSFFSDFFRKKRSR